MLEALYTPDATPSPAPSGSSTATAAHGVICRPMPAPSSRNGMISWLYEPVRSSSSTDAAASSAMPTAVGSHGPKRRPRRVPNGLTSKIGIVAGSSITPARSGLMSSTTCR